MCPPVVSYCYGSVLFPAAFPFVGTGGIDPKAFFRTTGPLSSREHNWVSIFFFPRFPRRIFPVKPRAELEIIFLECFYTGNNLFLRKSCFPGSFFVIKKIIRKESWFIIKGYYLDIYLEKMLKGLATGKLLYKLLHLGHPYKLNT